MPTQVKPWCPKCIGQPRYLVASVRDGAYTVWLNENMMALHPHEFPLEVIQEAEAGDPHALRCPDCRTKIEWEMQP